MYPLLPPFFPIYPLFMGGGLHNFSASILMFNDKYSELINAFDYIFCKLREKNHIWVRWVRDKQIIEELRNKQTKNIRGVWKLYLLVKTSWAYSMSNFAEPVEPFKLVYEYSKFFVLMLRHSSVSIPCRKEHLSATHNEQRQYV